MLSGDTVARSPLDQLIRPEIRNDAFCDWIKRIAATPGVHDLLEIGASSGAGSTESFVAGALRNPELPSIHCIEVARVRYEALEARYRDCSFVHCYHMSSVPLEAFPTAADLDAFRRSVWTRFRFIRRRKVLSWLQQDIDYIQREALSTHGIRLIRDMHAIDTFDAVLIDGSEFTGPADLNEVYGATFVLLDDIRTYKNYYNYHRLRADSAYRLLVRARYPRNGFAVFARQDAPAVAEAPRSGAVTP
jgi:hypothetical protein